MLLIRPAAAHRVTVLGSTRNKLATSPGVSRRSRDSTTTNPHPALRGAESVQCRRSRAKLSLELPESLRMARMEQHVVPWFCGRWRSEIIANGSTGRFALQPDAGRLV